MDVFSLGVLAATVDHIVPEYSYLTRQYFPGEQTQQGEEIFFDVRKKTRRISPFVSPYVQGQIVEKQGFRTGSLKPAYVKDKRVFDPNAQFTRTYGEPLLGGMSPMQRLERSVATETADQIEMLNRRLEVMCGEVLVSGTLTIEGELYPRVQLDFGRDASLSKNLSGANEWGDAGIDPLASLEGWAEEVFALSGYRPRDVTMTLDAFRLFRASASVQAWFDRFHRDDLTMRDSPADGDDGWDAGRIGGFNVTVYGGTYIDPMTNTSTDILPDYSVILGSGTQHRGYKAFGAIRDEKAGLQARKYFSKSWLTDDPAVRYLMLQSAPIVVPLYPDAILYAKVKQ